MSGLTDEQKKDLEIFIKALRSGKYRQIMFHLKKKDYDGSYKYCATGVACELFKGERQWITNEERTASLIPSDCIYTGSTAPDFLGDVLPIHWKDIMLKNDQGKSFEEIAEWLEREYL